MKITQDPRSAVVDSKEYALLRGKNMKRLQVYVANEVFLAILRAKISFRKMKHKISKFQSADVQKYFVENLMYVWANSSLPTCHDIGRKILQTYFNGRIKDHLRLRRADVASYNKKRKAINRSSKTAGMHDAANKVSAVRFVPKYF